MQYLMNFDTDTENVEIEAVLLRPACYDPHSIGLNRANILGMLRYKSCVPPTGCVKNSW